MTRWSTILPCAAWLAGCAAPGTPVATCTNLISMGGGLLRFCQAADKLHVSESGVDPGPTAHEVKIVDDPAVLGALERDIRPLQGFAASRALVARACVVKGRNYVSIAADDLKRIVAINRPDVTGSPADRP